MKPRCDAMLDKKLLGRTFGGPTFAAWRTVAKILDAAPLNRAEHALHPKLTASDSAPREAFREAYLIKPRPSRPDSASRSLGASSTTRTQSCELFRAGQSRGHPLSPGGASAVRARTHRLQPAGWLPGAPICHRRGRPPPPAAGRSAWGENERWQRSMRSAGSFCPLDRGAKA